MLTNLKHLLQSSTLLSLLALGHLAVMPASADRTMITTDTDESGATHSTIRVSAGVSYTGRNVTISNANEQQYATSITSTGGKFIHLTADEDSNSVVSLHQKTSGYMIQLYNMQEASTIERTHIEADMSESMDTYVFELDSSDMYLGDVEIRQTNAHSGSGNIIVARISDSTLTNKKDGKVLGSVYVEANLTSEYIPLFMTFTASAVIDLYDTTIVMGPGPRGSNSIFSANGDISLTDSKIVSQSNDNLVSRTDGKINFHNVDLSEAKNNVLYETFDGVITFSGNTHFDGYVANTSDTNSGDIHILDGASWNVTQDSELMQGKLTLDGTSTISFVSDEGGFTNINLAVALLEEGSILQLDKNADAFSPGDIITLFTGAAGDDFTNLGALLMSADGFSLDYIDLDNGQFLIPGVQIPEPSACLLGLAAAVCVALRRRKSA